MNIRFLITDETKWVAYGPCKVIRAYGFNNNASDRYIQFHEAPTVANGAVPVVPGLLAPASAPFAWDFNEDGVQVDELLIAISSTQVNYTGLTNTGLDMTVEIETDFPVVSGVTSVAGNLTAGVSDLQVWSEAAGATLGKRLLRIDFFNGNAAVANIFIGAADTATVATSEMTGNLQVASSASKRFLFGKGGIVPQQVTSAGEIKNGCTIWVAIDTSAPYSFTVPTSFNIRAIYE